MVAVVVVAAVVVMAAAAAVGFDAVGAVAIVTEASNYRCKMLACLSNDCVH